MARLQRVLSPEERLADHIRPSWSTAGLFVGRSSLSSFNSYLSIVFRHFMSSRPLVVADGRAFQWAAAPLDVFCVRYGPSYSFFCTPLAGAVRRQECRYRGCEMILYMGPENNEGSPWWVHAAWVVGGEDGRALRPKTGSVAVRPAGIWPWYRILRLSPSGSSTSISCNCRVEHRFVQGDWFRRADLPQAEFNASVLGSGRPPALPILPACVHARGDCVPRVPGN